MPRGTFTQRLAFFTISNMSGERLPPLVSHSTMVSAPEEAATFNTLVTYLALLLYPSKKCSISTNTSLSLDFRNLTVSDIILRLSSSGTRSTSLTWRSHPLATMVTTEVLALITAFSPGSSSTFLSALRVLPKATTLACESLWEAITSKNSLSFGLEPG